MEPLIRALAGAPGLSGWAKWMATSADRAAKDALQFFCHAFGYLEPRAQTKVLRRLRSADGSNVDGLLHELLMFDVCRRFGLCPEFEPQSGAKTPDLRLSIGDRIYFADVFVTSRPVKTRITFQGSEGYKDSGEAAKKMADALALKAARYAKLSAPVLVFVVLGGHDVGHLDLEIALYGSAIGEIAAAGGLKVRCHKDWHTHGVFCPPGPEARHRNVSAVVSCDWFASLARTGRRLHCVVYHHWNPDVVLPLGSFGRFPDVHFDQNSKGHFVPSVTGIPNLVMSTSPGNETKWAPYSANRPW